jgi:hypothetical protein
MYLFPLWLILKPYFSSDPLIDFQCISTVLGCESQKSGSVSRRFCFPFSHLTDWFIIRYLITFWFWTLFETDIPTFTRIDWTARITTYPEFWTLLSSYLTWVRNGCGMKQLTANTKSILIIETKHTTSWQEHYLSYSFMVLTPSNTKETQYLSTSVQVTIQLSIGSSILLHESLFLPQTHTLLETHHSTTCACGSKSLNIAHTENSQMIEDTETRYIKVLVCLYEIPPPPKKKKV